MCDECYPEPTKLEPFVFGPIVANHPPVLMRPDDAIVEDAVWRKFVETRGHFAPVTVGAVLKALADAGFGVHIDGRT